MLSIKPLFCGKCLLRLFCYKTINLVLSKIQNLYFKASLPEHIHFVHSEIMNVSRSENIFHSVKYQWYDYIAFFLMIIISVVIGLYHVFLETKVKSVTNYLLGNGNISVLPVAVSIVAR